MRRPFYIDDPASDGDQHPAENPATTHSRADNQPGAARARLRAVRSNPTARRIGSVGGGLAVVSGIVIAGIHAGTPHTSGLPAGYDPPARQLNLPPAQPPALPSALSSTPPAAPVQPPPVSITSVVPATPAGPAIRTAPPRQPVHGVSSAPRHSPVHATGLPPHGAHPARRPPTPLSGPPSSPAAGPVSDPVDAPQLAIEENEFRAFAGTLLSVEIPDAHMSAGQNPAPDIKSYLAGVVESILVSFPTQ